MGGTTSRVVHVGKISKADFAAQLASAENKLVLVDFFATWCGPCKMIAPVLETLASQYADKLVVIKVDVDESEDLAAEYNISSMPTFVFIKNGKTIETFSGANAQKLEQLVVQHTS